jgi:hypothetical protein
MSAVYKATAAPPPRSLKVRAMPVTALADAAFVIPHAGPDFGVDAGPVAVGRALRNGGRPSDHISQAVDALLVRDAGRLILTDTGLGERVGRLLAAGP